MTIACYNLASRSHLALSFVAMGGIAYLLARVVVTDVRANQPAWYIIFCLGWFLPLAFWAYRTVTSARAIVVHENDEIEFISLIQRIRVPAQSIQSIRRLRSSARESGRYSRVVVKHTGGVVRLAVVGQFKKIHQFLSELKRANPGVEFAGC